MRFGCPSFARLMNRRRFLEIGGTGLFGLTWADVLQAQAIRSKVVGLEVCEHLPKMAQIADKYTVLRSVNARGYPQAGDHFGGLSWKCGNRRGIMGTPKYPAYGSVAAKLLPAPRDLPAFVVMGELDRMAPGMKENCNRSPDPEFSVEQVVFV
jgi:hypothetical protein